MTSLILMNVFTHYRFYCAVHNTTHSIYCQLCSLATIYSEISDEICRKQNVQVCVQVCVHVCVFVQVSWFKSKDSDTPYIFFISVYQCACVQVCVCLCVCVCRCVCVVMFRYYQLHISCSGDHMVRCVSCHFCFCFYCHCKQFIMNCHSHAARTFNFIFGFIDDLSSFCNIKY